MCERAAMPPASVAWVSSDARAISGSQHRRQGHGHGHAPTFALRFPPQFSRKRETACCLAIGLPLK